MRKFFLPASLCLLSFINLAVNLASMTVFTVILSAEIAGAQSSQPECRSAYGQNACGYSCEDGYGQVKCAQTPFGACGSGYGQVVCWDPIQPQWNDRKAECLSGYGVVACGYNCESGYGQVKCAQTPNGICTSGYGEVKCQEFPRTPPRTPIVPQPPDYHGHPGHPDYPGYPDYPGNRNIYVDPAAPQCKSDYGQNQCGYNCESGYGQVKCAQTPYGVCGSGYGNVVCWDPPTPSLKGEATPQCLAGYGVVECGYNCTSGYGQVKCAQTPSGICTAGYGEVKCQEFPRTIIPPPPVYRPGYPQHRDHVGTGAHRVHGHDRRHRSE